MNAKTIITVETLLRLAQSTTGVQRQILFSLRDKGPGLPLEVAVRILKFPEDIAGDLRELRAQGLIRTDAFSGGQLGSEIIYLSDLGEQLVDVLRDQNMMSRLAQQQQPSQKSAVVTPATDPREREAELLAKLGDLAKQSGDLERARELYWESLNLTRQLSSANASTTPPTTPGATQ